MRTEQLRRSFQPLTGSIGWTSLGPAPLASDASGTGQEDYNWVSGRATAVAVDPADPSGNTVYAGGAYGGVWKSTNAGPLSQNPSNVVWNAVADDQPTLAVGTIAIQPQLGSQDPSKSVVLVGTGEANSSADSYYGLGILRSNNAGGSWTLISSDISGTHSFAGLAFSQMAFNTASPTSVVAAVAGASEGILEGLAIPLTANLGLYFSGDGGLSWTFASITDNGIAIAPDSATSVAYNATAETYFAAIRDHGIYASTDGRNWSRLTNQPGAGLTSTSCPTNPSSTACPIYRGEISVVPGRNELYVWYVDANDADQGIWKTNDGGNTWLPLNENGIVNCGDQSGCGTENGSYNLTLNAVPDGSATDLYAGAVNLYKCTITSTMPDCSGTGSFTFLNLTHVYGCPPNFGSIARVHPAQHATASLLVNHNMQDMLYFANDGGIYRALDGYTGLTNGTCGAGTNQFDSLNQTLGSLTQMNSFAQASGDPDVVLAGTQGNGAAGSASALLNSQWQAVNFGDNGFTQIDPTNEGLWYTSTPPDSSSGVNIFSCGQGLNCHTLDFQNNQIVSGASVGEDTGAYYPAYALDPQNPAVLMVGTCRIWRGSSSGGSFTVLSHSFETGGDGICTGSEYNLVRSLAAGGPTDNNGFSNVMYAGTDGYGPWIPTTPEGGHIWASTNVAAGPNTWVDQTANINPNYFPVSGIAIDASDPTGLTAYVSIMGFHTSHIWKTTNGGNSWTDFTGNLPDAPANTVIVDAGTAPSTIYAATDVGVFASSSNAPSWTEVGPAPGEGQGFLPNVAVTALGIFNNGANKLLRASTYGRGLWQFPLITTPDFVVSVPQNDLTAFGPEPAVFSGQIIALNGYNSQVNMSCAAGNTSPPPTCSVQPASVVPQSSGTNLSVTASGPDGDYSFMLHAAGTDSHQVTHDFPLTLHVVEFGLTQPSPSTLTVNEPGSSAPVYFQVTASGSFNGAVTLSCLGLPAGAGCSFAPANPVYPTSQNPASITLTITTSSSTPVGMFPLTIQATTPGGPNQTQPLSLTVTNVADYTLVIADPTSVTTSVKGLATYTGTLTSINGYSSTVNVGCVAGATSAPPSCLATPASLTPTSAGAHFTVAAKSSVVDSYRFQITGVGTDPSATTHSAAVALTTTFDFVIANTSSPQSVAAGEAAYYDLDLTPFGSHFPEAVTLACSGLPALSACAFSPNGAGAGSGDTPVTLSITTTAPVLARLRGSPRMFYALWLLVAGWVSIGTASSRRGKRRQPGLRLGGIVLLLAICLSCGGGSSGGPSASGSPGTNPGTYTVTVTAVSGALERSTPVILTVN